MQTIRLQNAKALELPEIEAFLSRAFGQPHWEGIPVTRFLAEHLTNPKLALLMGFRGNSPTGLVLISLPASPLSKHPEVIHFYCESGPVQSRALIKAGLDFIRENGYNTYWAVNMSERPDAVWSRALRPKGWHSRKVGTLMEFSEWEP